MGPTGVERGGFKTVISVLATVLMFCKEETIVGEHHCVRLPRARNPLKDLTVIVETPVIGAVKNASRRWLGIWCEYMTWVVVSWNYGLRSGAIM